MHFQVLRSLSALPSIDDLGFVTRNLSSGSGGSAAEVARDNGAQLPTNGHCNTALPHRSGTGALWPAKLRKSLATQIPLEQTCPLLHGWEAKRHQRELFPQYTAGTYLNKTTRDTPKSVQEINTISVSWMCD